MTDAQTLNLSAQSTPTPAPKKKGRWLIGCLVVIVILGAVMVVALGRRVGPDPPLTRHDDGDAK